jgi:hypothetical protein
MTVSKRIFFALTVTALAACIVTAQQPAGQAQSAPKQSTSGQSMPGMDMSSHDQSSAAPQEQGMKGMAGMDSETGEHTMDSHHMDMGPHMKMTVLRDPKPGDAERAQKVLEAARGVMLKYRDYHTALNEGFQIFHPEIPQNIYHFTNYQYGFENAFAFNPNHPTSLLYEKHGDDYKLVGVMYTAPKRLTEDDLDQRIPLSVAQWHEHVNFCKAPPDRWQESLPPNAKFGFTGSISTKEACDAAGGTFKPIVFNWMVHIYPNEKTEAEIWDASRGHDHNHAD